MKHIQFLNYWVDFSTYNNLYVEIVPTKLKKIDSHTVCLTTKFMLRYTNQYDSASGFLAYSLTFKNLGIERIKPIINEEIVDMVVNSQITMHRFNHGERKNILTMEQQTDLLNTIIHYIKEGAVSIDVMSALIDKILFS